MKNERDCIVGIQALAPNLISSLRVCSVMTNPSAIPDEMISGNERQPWSASLLPYESHLERSPERIREQADGEQRGAADPFEAFRQCSLFSCVP